MKLLLALGCRAMAQALELTFYRNRGKAMNAQIIEDVTKAEQGAGMLASDIQQAYKGACFSEPLLALLLLELITDARRIQDRLKQIEAALGGQS